jgi:NTP pyrophosphatase (non-canonical NTP hydrolase)
VNKDDRELDHVIAKTIQWHHDRNLVDGSTDKAQLIKLHEEVAELTGFVEGDGSDFRDHVGDILVVLINLCERNQTSLETCLNVAYEEIKDRTGRMVEGVFIKDAA